MDTLLIFFAGQFLDKPLWMWAIFLGIILALIILDLGFFHRKNHEMGIKESATMSAFYIGIGLLFGAWIWHSLGSAKAMEYWTGFVVEKTLAMDNIFVIAMIFGYFKIPRLYQHRVLFWGILGVILLRGLMIGFGAYIVHQFEWVLYLFAAFLILTGIKMLFAKEDEDKTLADNPIVKFMYKHFRVTKELHDDHFIIRQENPKTGKMALYITPLLVTLVVIELADVIFAVDSIPAIFAITTDTYIVYTSNIFAIIGLRALYFILAALISRFVYLKYALSIILVFIGGKVFVTDLLSLDKFPPALSLGITVSVLVAGMVFSLLKTQKEVK